MAHYFDSNLPLICEHCHVLGRSPELADDDRVAHDDGDAGQSEGHDQLVDGEGQAPRAVRIVAERHRM